MENTPEKFEEHLASSVDKLGKVFKIVLIVLAVFAIIGLATALYFGFR